MVTALFDRVDDDGTNGKVFVNDERFDVRFDSGAAATLVRGNWIHVHNPGDPIEEGVLYQARFKTRIDLRFLNPKPK